MDGPNGSREFVGRLRLELPRLLREDVGVRGQIDRLLSQARQDPRVLAVVLFGSVARGEETARSDIDVCLVLAASRYTPVELSRIKLEYLGEGELDVQVFQQLPLYIRRRVLQDGQVVFSRDDDALYELAFRTARAFERFKTIYRTYLDEVAGARS